MRTIEKEMLQAIEKKHNWMKSNTLVQAGSIGALVYLFDNHIGTYHYDTEKFETNLQTLLEWPSVTTISRLRALGVNVRQKNWKLYIDDQLVDAKLAIKHDILHLL